MKHRIPGAGRRDLRPAAISAAHDRIGRLVAADSLRHAAGAAVDHGEVGMALALLAAHEVMHDGGDVDDFMAMAAAAWGRTERMHREQCSGPTRGKGPRS